MALLLEFWNPRGLGLSFDQICLILCPRVHVWLSDLCWTSFSFGVSKWADDLLHTVLCVLLDVALEEVIWKLQEWMMKSDFSWKRWCQQNSVLVSQDRWAISSPFSRSWWMITVYLFIFLVYFVHSSAVIETSFPKLLFCHFDPFCSGNDGLLS